MNYEVNKSCFRFVHEDNFLNKIDADYNSLHDELYCFYETSYLPLRDELWDMKLNFGTSDLGDFDDFAGKINDYYKSLLTFCSKHRVTSQSKLASSFLEELSVYLVKDHPNIASGKYEIVNKGVFAGLTIENDKIKIQKKDVDFCIAKPSIIRLDGYEIKIVLPVIAVEVKTYLDATMLGEIRSSSKAIKTASSNAKSYVLMLYNDAADSKLLMAKQEAAVDEMFALQANEYSPISGFAIYEYWRELQDALNEDQTVFKTNPPGRLLHPSFK